jgi:hypothetical protein
MALLKKYTPYQRDVINNILTWLSISGNDITITDDFNNIIMDENAIYEYLRNTRNESHYSSYNAGILNRIHTEYKKKAKYMKKTVDVSMRMLAGDM